MLYVTVTRISVGIEVDALHWLLFSLLHSSHVMVPPPAGIICIFYSFFSSSILNNLIRLRRYLIEI
jgi:hypothetical protein